MTALRMDGTVADHQRDLVPYQRVLRTLGAYLDEVEAAWASVIETRDGFVVRYQQDGTQPGLQVTSLTSATLRDWRTRLTSRRVARRWGRPGPTCKGNRSGYQDVLRAVGYELERVAAYTVLLDESDEGILVTYQYLDPRQDYLFRKAALVLPWEQVGQLLGVARRRRGRQSRSDRSSLFHNTRHTDR